MISPEDSLLKFAEPLLLCKDARTLSQASREGSPEVIITGPTPTSPTKGTSVHAQEIVKVLNSVLPPREWTENNEVWQQSVSSEPSTRLDVVDLQEQLDLKLKQRQARDKDICRARRDLYSQCFDELIRQVTVDCPERGMLLSRVRDEILMTIKSYEALYNSSFEFAKRKALQAKEEKSVRQKKISELEKEKMELERQLKELEFKRGAQQKQEMERQKADDKKHAEEVRFLKQTNIQLKNQLDVMKLSRPML